MTIPRFTDVPLSATIPADAAEQQKRAVAAFKADAGCQHGVRVILLRGMTHDGLVFGNIAERIKVSHHEVRVDAAKLRIAAVRRDDKIALLRGKRVILRQRADDIADGCFAHLGVRSVFRWKTLMLITRSQ